MALSNQNQATQNDTFTASEASALTGVPAKFINKEIEENRILVEKEPRNVRSKRRLRASQLVYLSVLAKQTNLLNPALRGEISRLIESSFAKSTTEELRKKLQQEKSAELSVEPLLKIDLRKAALAIVTKAENFRAWKCKRVRSDKDVLGGEPTFSGSRLSVRHIGAVLDKGETEENILQDYPYLSKKDLQMARIFAQSSPHVGRPKAKNPTG